MLIKPSRFEKVNLPALVTYFCFCSSAPENVGSSCWWIGKMRPAQRERTAFRRLSAAASRPASTATLTSTAASTWPRMAPSSARGVRSAPQGPHTHMPMQTTISRSPLRSLARGWSSTLKNSTKWPPRWRKGSHCTAPQQQLAATPYAPSRVQEPLPQ